MSTFAKLALLAILLVGCDQVKQSSSSDDRAASEQSAVRDTVTIAMTGDIMMGSIYPKERLPIDSARHIFDDVAPLLRQADVACGNLEGTFAYSGTPRKNPASKLAFMFMMPPHFAPRLVEAGYDFVGLANNHIYDFWEPCITTTEQALDAVGMGYAGAKDPNGKNQHQEMCIKQLNGVKYGFCAFCHEDYTVRLQDTASVHRIIKTLRSQCDYVIVSFHGGNEGTIARHLPDEIEYFHGDDRGHLRRFTHLCIDWGADVVYGHGPHVCRAIELYKGHLIAYSLGNFCTTGMGVAGATGYAPVLIAQLDQDGKFIGGQIHSFLQQPMLGPKTDTEHHAAKEIAELTQADIQPSLLEISADGVIKVARLK